jgi:hypothetical protein
MRHYERLRGFRHSSGISLLLRQLFMCSNAIPSARLNYRGLEYNVPRLTTYYSRRKRRRANEHTQECHNALHMWSSDIRILQQMD